MLCALAVVMLALVESVCRIPDEVDTFSAPINQFGRRESV